MTKEDYTREATVRGPYLKGVGAAISSLHGWSDGDEFLTSYVGHPMEGAVAGYIFSHSDPEYRVEEFGQNRAYWRGKTRAFVFSAVYSLVFEIDLSGCNLFGLPQSYSGDSLTYMIGGRWSPKNASRMVPHVRMVGGHKIYEERLFPDLRNELLARGTYYMTSISITGRIGERTDWRFRWVPVWTSESTGRWASAWPALITSTPGSAR